MEKSEREWGLVSHCNTQQGSIWPDGNSARNYAYTTSPENRILGLTESVASTATATWGYGYDLADRLVNALATPSGAYTYGLDAGDNLLSIQTPASSTTRTCNSLNKAIQTRDATTPNTTTIATSTPARCSKVDTLTL